MTRLLCLFALAVSLAAASTDNLIVCDAIPAMQNLANHQTSEITSQDKLPASLTPCRNAVVYIHGDLHEPAELAFISYAKNGGNLILLHHKYIDDAVWELVFAEGAAFTMHHTEIYLYHQPDPDRTVLSALRFRHPKDGQLYEQNTAAWTEKTGKGTVWYFMPGHKATDFEYEPFVKLLMQSVV